MANKWERTGDPSRDMGNAVQDRLADKISGAEYERRHKILDTEMRGRSGGEKKKVWELEERLYDNPGLS